MYPSGDHNRRGQVMKERREKVFTVDPQFLVQLMNSVCDGRPGMLMVPQLDRGSVPEGATVEAIMVDGISRVIHVVVYHESFDIVPAGEMLPYFGAPDFTKIVWIENSAYAQELDSQNVRVKVELTELEAARLMAGR